MWRCPNRLCQMRCDLERRRVAPAEAALGSADID
jgi:hypothetical protein